MNILRLLSISSFALCLSSNVSFAQSWPMKSVKIISPFPAGGATDVLARLLALNLSQSLGQSFVVESRPGAGGNIGTDLVAKANPDGYVIGISSSGPLANNKYLYKSMPFDGLQER